jgi:hypothetical protein
VASIVDPDPDGKIDAPAPQVHTLKAWPEWFVGLLDGTKTFELRRDDRGYRVGDVLRIWEYDPGRDECTGREVSAWITYILRDCPQFGLMPDYAILGIER